LSSILAWAFAGTELVLGQELEPRAYSPSPIGTNFVVGTYSTSSGNVSLDPSLPLSDVTASVDTSSLGFLHTFSLAGHSAGWAVTVPYIAGNITAAVYGRASAAARYGFGDARARLTMQLIGRAMTPSAFARRKPSTTLGVSLSAVLPTGTYDPTRLINMGSNRWSFKPEIGFEQPMGNWFLDGSAGVWLFGSNPNYFGGAVLHQDPLTIVQFHGGYSFRTGQWLAADANYYSGGATRIGGAMPINPLANSRYGASFSQPFGRGYSTKVAWSHWLSGQFGQNFSTLSVTLQYRWFDRTSR